jgi:hypothetical protein
MNLMGKNGNEMPRNAVTKECACIFFHIDLGPSKPP